MNSCEYCGVSYISGEYVHAIGCPNDGGEIVHTAHRSEAGLNPEFHAFETNDGTVVFTQLPEPLQVEGVK